MWECSSDHQCLARYFRQKWLIFSIFVPLCASQDHIDTALTFFCSTILASDNVAEMRSVSVCDEPVCCPQDQLDATVKVLLELKGQYKALTGEEYKPVTTPGAPGGSAGENKSRKERENKSEKQEGGGGGGGGGGKKKGGDKNHGNKEGGAGAGGGGEGPKKQTRCVGWGRKRGRE